MSDPLITTTVVVHLTKIDDTWLNLGPVHIQTGDSGLLLIADSKIVGYQPLLRSTHD
jgi:hypothetical protein